MNHKIQHNILIPEEYAGYRLDRALAALFLQYSRSRLQTWLEKGHILVNGKSMRAKDKVIGGETVDINAELSNETEDKAEAIPLNIIYEDQDILVINKPVGMVVHPAVGNRQGTLLNALLHHAPSLKQLPRAGIIHRLDKETSGLLVIAKNIETHTYLVKALQDRKISREYEAIVQGTMTGGGTIDEPIGRHPRTRTKMAIVDSGKPAVTHYTVIKRFPAHTYIRIKLETGRTHQIRVHMAHIHHPIVGDPTYGGRMKLPKGASTELIETLKNFKRQALHAKNLSFIHPKTGKRVSFEAPLPADMLMLLEVLEKKL